MKGPLSTAGDARTICSSFAMICALLLCILPVTLSAKEITYTGFTVADGKLGSWEFHAARIYLTYRGDTKNVQTMISPPQCIPSTVGPEQVEVNMGGAASVTIITDERTEQANFEPGQVVVSLDEGLLNSCSLAPLDSFHGGRGVGFSTISPSSQTGFEPAYPLGMEDGTIDWGDVHDTTSITYYASPELAALPIDLKHSTAFSGRGWICVGFPTNGGPCSPPLPLRTDKGALTLYQPYQDFDHVQQVWGNPLVGGFFTASLGRGSSSPRAYNTSVTSRDEHGSGSITYTGALVSNVNLDDKHYEHAQVYISFDADSDTVEPFQDVSSAGFMNKIGHGRLKIISGEEVINADIDPDQLYVYFDTRNGSVGFGLNGSPRGYPFAITQNQDGNTVGLAENSLVGAVADILQTPSDAVNYTDATAKLSADLRSPTLLSGAVSSCAAFDPTTSICSDLTPIAIKTSRGDFYLYEPYVVDTTLPSGTTIANGTQPYSINWGVFWATVGTGAREGE